MSTLKKEAKNVLVNPLLAVQEIRPCYNWHELMEFWDAAETVQQRESIIHQGYDIPLTCFSINEKEYDEIDRHMFYWAVADGWADYSLLESLEDKDEKYFIGRDSIGNKISKTPRELRQDLATKAFNKLCLNFFKEELMVKNSQREFNIFWEEVVLSGRLFPIIQSFFRVKERSIFGGFEIRNLPIRREIKKQSHNEKLAITFLVNLAKFVWLWEGQEVPSYWESEEKKAVEDSNAAVRFRLDLAKPWLIEILSKIRRFDLLREWLLELDKPCLKKLKEIALRNELSNIYHPVRENRRVKTLDEARYLGSSAAWLLAEYELKTKEHERLGAIFKKEQKKQDLERELKKLNGGK